MKEAIPYAREVAQELAPGATEVKELTDAMVLIEAIDIYEPEGTTFKDVAIMYDEVTRTYVLLARSDTESAVVS